MSERLDERLRRAARTYRRLGNHTAEGMFLEAADTICELRDDLQRTHGLLDDAEHDESRAWDRARKAEAENAKLRELVRDVWHEGMCECDERGACAECEYGYLDRMRELGVDE